MYLLRLHALYLFFATGILVAQPTPPKLPDWPVLPTVDVVTPPKPVAPQPASILKDDQLYIVQTDTPSILIASPEGIVSISERKGPVVIHGRFVDGGTKVGTRTYEGKQVWIIEATGTGSVELLKVPVGAKAVSEVERRIVAVNGPIPPPKPDDPPTPPKPTAPIIGIDGTAVLIIYESADTIKYTKEQGAILSSLPLYKYLDSVCAPHPDGKTKAWRIWDKDTSGKFDSPAFDAAMQRARKGTPWIIVSSKLGNYEGPLQADVASTTALVQKTIEGK